MPRHVAIIMDGNGRWAKQKNKSRTSGHNAGALAVRKAIEFAVEHQIESLSLYAFSKENWRRPQQEVNQLMSLFSRVLKNYKGFLNDHNVRLNVIGDIAEFSPELQVDIKNLEQSTQNNTGLTLNIAANYSGRWDIAQATKKTLDLVLERLVIQLAQTALTEKKLNVELGSGNKDSSDQQGSNQEEIASNEITKVTRNNPSPIPSQHQVNSKKSFWQRVKSGFSGVVGKDTPANAVDNTLGSRANSRKTAENQRIANNQAIANSPVENEELISLKSDSGSISEINPESTFSLAQLRQAVDSLKTTFTVEEVEKLLELNLTVADQPPIDLIIRTSNEQRISNFFLWQAAYSEFVFLEEYWPDFNADIFMRAIELFNQRQRRFGGL